jgi:vacuolar-type H+-ATPase subunit H
MTSQASEVKSKEERYPDNNASKIQSAISVLSEMETKLDELSNQVSDMKRKLLNFAETESEKTKSEVIETANREAQEALEAVRRSAQMDADSIIAKGSSDIEVLRSKISGKVSSAADVIVDAVQSF